jgi:murein DD-endopeptidase MepM/ murein hydrolase activator NlpD
VTLPLQVSKSDPLEGGYAFLDLTADGVTPHPGVDLNAGTGGDSDCGMLVVAAVHGWLRFAGSWDGRTTGEGNHAWVEVDDAVPGGDPSTYDDVPSYCHYDHLQSFTPGLALDQEVFPNTVVGRCGKTGNWPWCHTHWEVMRHKPSTWTLWPKGYSRSSVKRHYHDPFAFASAYVPKVAAPPSTPVGGPAPTLEDALDALRLANLIKHEFESYLVDGDHARSVDGEAAAEGIDVVSLMIRWAHDHYEAGESAP